MKQAPFSYKAAYERVAEVIGYPAERRTRILAIEGLPSAGKSSLASWLAWQFGMPVVHLDLFLVPGDIGELAWRENDIAQAIRGRAEDKRTPLVVEGVFAFAVLEKIGFTADLKIFVENLNNISDDWLVDLTRSRCQDPQFQKSVDLKVTWSDPMQTIEEARIAFEASLEKWQP